MAAVNDIVIPYDLPYQAKDALKRHVPQPLDGGPTTLVPDQPVRLTNRAAVFGYSVDRINSFCWEVPQFGRETNVWIPLAINPDQREWWHQLLDGEATAGQLQLVHRPRQSRWNLTSH